MIRAVELNLVVLDLALPGADGFSVMETIGLDVMPPTIVVTADSRRAARAFDLRAIDCLLKPCRRERLLSAVARARAHLESSRNRDVGTLLLRLAREGEGLQARVSRIPVKSGRRVVYLTATDIVWIESLGNYVRVRTADQIHVVRETMSGIGDRLKSSRFARIHRTRIVNLDRVRELRPRGNGTFDLALDDGSRLSVGRSYQRSLVALLNGLTAMPVDACRWTPLSVDRVTNRSGLRSSRAPGDATRGRPVRRPAVDSPAEIAKHLRTLPAGDDRRTVAHRDLEARAVVRLERRHEIQVDDVRAMDAQERARIEPRLQVGELEVQAVDLAGRVYANVVVAGFEALHAPRGYRDQPGPFADEQPRNRATGEHVPRALRDWRANLHFEKRPCPLRARG